MHGSIFFALNVEGGKAPSRVQLLPVGPKVKGRDGRNWKLDSPSVVRATLARGLDLPVDVNHAQDLKAPKGDPSPAFGWLHDPALNATGEIWADVSWTDEGRRLVETRTYRYLSPVFAYNAEGEILALYSASLTNRPNLNLAALNNEIPPSESGGNTEATMKKICAELGLAESATEDQVLAALKTFQDKNKPTALNAEVDLTKYAPRADVQVLETRALNAEKALAEIKASDLKARSEAAVAKAIQDRKIAPVSKEAYLAMCASEDGLKQFVEVMKVTPNLIPEGAAPNGLPPTAGTALNADELAVAKAAGYSPAEFAKLKEGSK